MLGTSCAVTRMLGRILFVFLCMPGRDAEWFIANLGVTCWVGRVPCRNRLLYYGRLLDLFRLVHSGSMSVLYSYLLTRGGYPEKR